jgi:hypothetical protein
MFSEQETGGLLIVSGVPMGFADPILPAQQSQPPSEPPGPDIARRQTARRTMPRRTPLRPVVVSDHSEGRYLVAFNDGAMKWMSPAVLEKRFPKVGKRLVAGFDKENFYYAWGLEPTPVLRGKRQGYRVRCAEKLAPSGKPDTRGGLVWTSPIVEGDELPEVVRGWVESTNGVVQRCPWVPDELRTDFDFVLAPRLRGRHPFFELVRLGDVASIAAKYPIGAIGDYAYQVKFRSSARPDEWVPASHLDFVPNDSAIPTVAAMDSGCLGDEAETLPPRPPTDEEQVQEWAVFCRYFQQDFQKKLRESWKRQPSRTGVVSHALKCFCPLGVYRRLLEGRGSIVTAHSGVRTHKFLPSEVPFDLVGVPSNPTVDDDGFGWGPSTQAWWRSEYSDTNAIAPGDTEETCTRGFPERKLWAISTAVSFHWSPDLLRMSVSFRYLHAVRPGPPEPSKMWIPRFGPDVPDSLIT